LFFSSRIHRKTRHLGALVLSGALVAGFALAGPASAASPTAKAVNHDGNMKCADMAPAGITWEEFKIDDIPDDGPYEIPNTDLVVTIDNASSQTFDWASNFDMSAVLVKGGNGGMHYQYPGTNDRSDTGLHALVQNEETQNYHDISHVSFCYQVGGDTGDTDTTDTGTTDTGTTETGDTGTQVLGETLTAADPPATEVLGETVVQDATLPRTGATAIPLALAGGLGLASGLTMLLLGRRKTAVQSS
jgi:LPXTG-motif cell wall-anchored protein